MQINDCLHLAFVNSVLVNRTYVPTSKTNLEFKSLNADQRPNIWKPQERARLYCAGRKLQVLISAVAVLYGSA